MTLNDLLPQSHAVHAIVDSKADIFAIGLIINEMFTGEIP